MEVERKAPDPKREPRPKHEEDADDRENAAGQQKHPANLFHVSILAAKMVRSFEL